MDRLRRPALVRRDRGSLAWIALARGLLGISRRGADLASQLGHDDFCAASDVAAYADAHHTLTGLRGVLAPPLGRLFFAGFDPGLPLPLRVPALGSHLYGLCLLLCCASALGFVRLQRSRAAS